MKHIHLLYVLAFVLFTSSVFAQSITFTNPDDFFTCNEADFQVNIANNTSSTLENITVHLDFPCEIAYVAGTIGGATEGNISDLNQPVFNLANLPAGNSVVLSFSAHAPCAVSACVDAGQLFSYNLDLDYTGGQLHNVSSGEFDMETSLLVFTQVDDPILHGIKGQTITRTFSVRNTRPGPVHHFVFTDTHDNGLAISATSGTDISTSNDELKLSFDGADFQNIGDGDDLLEQGEELIITEQITILVCGQEQIAALSDLHLDWGCDNQNCGTFDFNAVVYIDLNTELGDILTFDSTVIQPTCYCSTDPITQSLSITNHSPYNDAGNILIEFEPLKFGEYFLERDARMIKNGDTLSISTVFASKIEPYCTPFENCYTTMSFTVPSIEAGETVTILWDMNVCKDGLCLQEGLYWAYSGSYYKDCTIPDDTYHVIPKHDVQPTNLLLSSIEAAPLQDGQYQTIKFHVASPFLDSLSGILNLAIDLPCGMTIQEPIDWSFNGTPAATIDIDSSGDITHITLEYPTPIVDSAGFVALPVFFALDTVCYPHITVPKDSLWSSCSFICVGEAGCVKVTNGANITLETTLLLDSACQSACNIQYCNNKTSTFDADIAGLCVDTVAGYASYTFDFYRTTLGQADNDDNHEPDLNGSLDLNNIRRDRAVAGDSLHADVQAIIITDLPSTAFSNGYLELRIGVDSSFGVQVNLKAQEIKKLLNPVSGFQNFAKAIRIYDKSENTYYTCPIVPDGEPATLSGQTLLYYYDISPSSLASAGGNVPVNYLYEKGDSILFEADYRINYNFNNGSAFGFFSLNLAPTIFLANEPFPAKEDLFACNCKEAVLDVANITCFAQDGFANTVDICGGGTSDEGLALPFYYGVFPNFFPNEYRKTANLTQIKIPQIEGLELTNAYIEFATLNGQYILDSTVIHYSSIEPAMVSYPNEDVTGFYIFNESDLPELFWDDNVYVRLRLNYKNSGCQFIGGTNFLGELTSELLPQNSDYHEQIDSTFRMRLTGKHPSLNLDFDLCDKLALSDSVSWGISISNILDFQCPHVVITDAPNVWIRPYTVGNSMDNYRLFDQFTGQEIMEQNGIFQLDSILQCDTMHLTLTAINHQCDPVDVHMQYGWSCTPYTNPLEEPCASSIKTCKITSPPGVIDLIPDSMALSAGLCEEMPWSYVKVFDAGLGAVFGVKVKAQLPPGLMIQTGTSEMEWPGGSGNFVPVSDPADLGNDQYQWSVTDALDTLQAHGLPGVQADPANSVTIRFKTLTTCDFISGSFIIYSASAKKICNLPTNTVAKIGEALQVENVSTPYTTSMTIGTDGNPGCQDSLSIMVHLSFSDTTGSQDHLFAQLPPNVSFVPNSCSGSLPNCQPTINGNELEWNLPQGVTTANLAFKVTGFLGQDCQTVGIPFYATSLANTLCVSTNQDCTIKVQTGAQVATIDIEKPIFSISSFVAIPIDGNDQLVNLSMNVQNLGILNYSPIIAKLYLDEDGDGTISASDVFLQSFSFDKYLDQGDATYLDIFAQAIDPADICKLMMVIGSPENCVCAPTVGKVQTPIVYPSVKTDTICSGETLSIGRPALAGHSYQWENNTGIECLTCAETHFTQVNESFNAVTYMLILKDNADCLVSYEYEITVLPKPRIWSADEQICQGDISTLVASDALSYQWQGEGITAPEQQIQMVSPLNTGLYIVTITNDKGCQNIDSVIVNVLPAPVADAGADISVCQGMTAHLNANVAANLDISWTPGFPKITDPNIADPTILTTTNTTFNLTVSNGTCTSTDEVNVLFFDGVNLTISPDTSICLGDTVTLHVSGADTYIWTPNTLGMCQDAACSTVQIAPTESLHLTVKGMTNDGCEDTIGVQVTIIEDTLRTTSNLDICEGSSIVLFGQTVHAAGVYCDTIEHATGCYEIKCVQVNVLDSIVVNDTAQICAGENYMLNDMSLTESGVYCVDTMSQGGCDSTYCLLLEVLPSPSISTQPNSGFIQIGDSIVLEVTGNIQSAHWSPSGNLSCSECLTSIASPTETTLYHVDAIDNNGCHAIDSVLISVETLCNIEIEIPNAFTPNGDGQNDLFRIANLNPDFGDIQITLFSRWGEKVFTEKGNHGWDGKYKGKKLPADVYVYLVVLDCVDGERKAIKGDVILLR